MVRRFLYACSVIFFLLFAGLSDFAALPASGVIDLERDVVILESQDTFAPGALKKIGTRRRNPSPPGLGLCSGIRNGPSTDCFVRSRLSRFSSPVKNQPRKTIFRI